jgi:hemerythrin-like domain-containing protein
MLTATYTLVALSVEQATVRLSLLSFQKYVRSTLMQQNSITLSQLEYACENLNSLYQACHWRKTEMYLIPALRETTGRADKLLDELNHLNQAALAAIRTLQERMGIFADVRDFQVEQVCDSIETCCSALLKRLEKEEQELFAMARGLIGGETWFSIANQLMMHDKHVEEMKRSGVALGDQAPPAVAAKAKAKAEAVAGRRMPNANANANANAWVDDSQITIPGLQVLPTVEVDGAGMPPGATVYPARQQSLDDAFTK